MSFPTKIDNSRSLPEKDAGLNAEGFDPITELERIRKEWDTELCSFSASAEDTQTLTAAPESPDSSNSRPNVGFTSKSGSGFASTFEDKRLFGPAEKVGKADEVEELTGAEETREKMEENGDFFEIDHETAKINAISAKISKNDPMAKKPAISSSGGTEQDIFASISKNDSTPRRGIHARPDSRSPEIYSQISHSPQSVIELNIQKENNTHGLGDLVEARSLEGHGEGISRGEFDEQNLFVNQKQADFSGRSSKKPETQGTAFRPYSGINDQTHETEFEYAYRGEQVATRPGGDFSPASNLRKSSPEQYRIDPPHTQSGVKEEDMVIVPRNDMAFSELFGWFCVALGLVGVILGTLFYLKGILSEMIPIWSYGMPIALVGALVIVFGLLIQLRRLMKLRAGDGEVPEKSEKDRYVAKKLIEIQERLEELRIILNEDHITKTQPYPSASSSSSSMPM